MTKQVSNVTGSAPIVALTEDLQCKSLSFLNCTTIAIVRRVNKELHRLTSRVEPLAVILYQSDANYGSQEEVQKLLSERRLRVARGAVDRESTFCMPSIQGEQLFRAGLALPKHLNLYHPINYTGCHNFMTGEAVPIKSPSPTFPCCALVQDTYNRSTLHITRESVHTAVTLPYQEKTSSPLPAPYFCPGAMADDFDECYSTWYLVDLPSGLPFAEVPWPRYRTRPPYRDILFSAFEFLDEDALRSMRVVNKSFKRVAQEVHDYKQQLTSRA